MQELVVPKIVDAPAVDDVAAISAQDMEASRTALADMLRKSSNGVVSAQALRKVLQKLGVVAVEESISRLRFAEPLTPSAERIYWKGRSFLTAEAFQRGQEEIAKDAEAASSQVHHDDDERKKVEPEESNRKQNTQKRQEEARLCQYILEAIEDIYASETGPGEEAPYAFDVHSERAGSDYENVDLLAVDWRAPGIVEFVAVEAKLEFSSKLVQQAANYLRFADRVWIAVPVRADFCDAAAALRESDPRLFDHVVSLGIGILACRLRPGKAYEVKPVQWPRLGHPVLVEREAFIERHRKTFEEAGAVEPRRSLNYPKFR